MPSFKEGVGIWKTLLQLLALSVVCSACDLQDSKIFRDVKGWGCASWNGHNCSSQVQFDGVYSSREILAVQINCPVACGFCITTTAVTTTGTVEVSPNTDDDGVTLWGVNLIWYFSIPVIAAFIIFLVIFIRRMSYNYRHARLRRQRHHFMQRMADGSYAGSQEALISLRRRLGLETDDDDVCPIPLPTYEEAETSRTDDPNLPPSYAESEASSPTRRVSEVGSPTTSQSTTTTPTSASLRRACSLRPPPPSPGPDRQPATTTTRLPSPSPSLSPSPSPSRAVTPPSMFRDVQHEITPPSSPSSLPIDVDPPTIMRTTIPPPTTTTPTPTTTTPPPTITTTIPLTLTPTPTLPTPTMITTTLAPATMPTPTTTMPLPPPTTTTPPPTVVDTVSVGLDTDSVGLDTDSVGDLARPQPIRIAPNITEI